MLINIKFFGRKNEILFRELLLISGLCFLNKQIDNLLLDFLRIDKLPDLNPLRKRIGPPYLLKRVYLPAIENLRRLNLHIFLTRNFFKLIWVRQLIRLETFDVLEPSLHHSRVLKIKLIDQLLSSIPQKLYPIVDNLANIFGAHLAYCGRLLPILGIIKAPLNKRDGVIKLTSVDELSQYKFLDRS